MFAVNGPTGPSSRHERRVMSDRQRNKENETTKRCADKAQTHFFREKRARSTHSKRETEKVAKSEGRLDIFKGCRIVFNGRTGKVSSYYLAKLVQEHGGNVVSSMATRITHMVGLNLSNSKADKVLRSASKFKFVSPEWILQSIKHKTRQPEFDYLVYKDYQTQACSFLDTR
ncbi:unnamed protein product [Peronospora belbahrii]|uniref:BRCT domain-containing protein n=1 Tax=Peronospora belbahrii TaxID=622444 RepID=A0AAU9L8B2_9STRA|nr:unnamed protein product [Peronospora belbahrii]